MKKLFSKKSGFTLVEILVAFVIFSIMAAMILSIARLAVAARASNNEFARELAVQKEQLVKKDKSKEPKYDSTSGNTDTFALDFGGGTTVSIDYEVRSADPTATYVEEGLNYFVPDVIPQNSTPQKDDPGGNSGNSQFSQFDTRITGTKGLNFIRIQSVEKYGPVDGKVRYIINTSILDSYIDKTVLTEQFMPYAQYKIYFRDDKNITTKEIKKKDGGTEKTYIRELPGVVDVLEVGYVDQSGNFLKTQDTNNPFKLTRLNNGGVQIGYDYTGTLKTFADGGRVLMYVDFSYDPQLTVDSFGRNPVENGGMRDYYNFEDDDGKIQPNIYGAFVYNDVEKVS